MLVPKILNLKTRTDFNLLQKKYDSIWAELISLEKIIERSALKNKFHNPTKPNKTEFIEELALSFDFRNNSNIVLI